MSTHQNKHQARKDAAVAKQAQPVVTAHGSDAAPVIYFDGAVAYGITGSIARLELATTCSVPVLVGGKPEARQRVVVTAHLRCSVEALAQLAETIEACLGMGKLPEPVANKPDEEKA